MKNCSSLLLCIFLGCSVWAVHGMSLQVSIDDDELGEPIVDAEGVPGMCWGCQWALKKVKKMIVPTTDTETIKKRLRAVCDELGLLKSKCHKFVEAHLGLLIEELTTTDSVKKICIMAKACKPKEMDLIYRNTEESRRMKLTEAA